MGAARRVLGGRGTGRGRSESKKGSCSLRRAATLHGSGRRHDRAKLHESQPSCWQRHPGCAWVDNIGNIDNLGTRESLGACRTAKSRDGAANAAIRQDAGRFEVHGFRQSRQETRCDEAKANADVGGWRRCVVESSGSGYVVHSTPAAAAGSRRNVSGHARQTPAKWRRLDSGRAKLSTDRGGTWGRDSDGTAKVKPGESELQLFAFHIVSRLGALSYE